MMKPQCEKCGCELPEPGAICPACGSRLICLDERFGLDELSGKGISIKGKSDSYKSHSGKHSNYYTMYFRKEFHRKLGKIVTRFKSEDRLNDRYIEKVETLDGTVVHDVDMPLTKHHGHGTASQKQDGE